ncbi:MAG: helix-turn-helix transcriptional regulator [Chitinophagaceae bacterium]|nr:helix-turn-helix transcriptional regulator [Chitinophagaceae bacterium]MDX1954447.1 helix-turn-helix transcriptional regulator [Chitinophagaceae bacterium]
MIPGNTVILDQIKLAIKETWDRDFQDLLGHRSERVTLPSSMLDEPPFNAGAAPSISLTRIRQRVNELEEQNEQLYNCLFYLIEKLPELVIRTVRDESVPHQKNGASKQTETGYTNWSEKDPGNPTRREKDVLTLLSKGYCAKEIAAKLYISETTVITHKKNLKRKFKAKNTAELISKMRDAGSGPA